FFFFFFFLVWGLPAGVTDTIYSRRPSLTRRRDPFAQVSLEPRQGARPRSTSKSPYFFSHCRCLVTQLYFVRPADDNR
ncbi:hypothetical protein F4818DRAFT_419205, partial [Hypoxylon cercidicola]